MFMLLSTELEAYGSVVSTLRAQGELNKDRKKLLEDLSVLMKISPERHKAEIRRAVNDEKLGCIANRYHIFTFFKREQEYSFYIIMKCILLILG